MFPISVKTGTCIDQSRVINSETGDEWLSHNSSVGPPMLHVFLMLHLNTIEHQVKVWLPLISKNKIKTYNSPLSVHLLNNRFLPQSCFFFRFAFTLCNLFSIFKNFIIWRHFWCGNKYDHIAHVFFREVRWNISRLSLSLQAASEKQLCSNLKFDKQSASSHRV